MRFVVELGVGPAGAVEGTVTRGEADTPSPFSGWLELLRLLEEQADTDRGGRDRIAATDGH